VAKDFLDLLQAPGVTPSARNEVRGAGVPEIMPANWATVVALLQHDTGGLEVLAENVELLDLVVAPDRLAQVFAFWSASAAEGEKSGRLRSDEPVRRCDL
jgi:hypothetical protein